MMRGLPVLTAAVIAIALCGSTIPAHGQDTPAIEQSQDTAQKPAAQTFVGTIAKDGDTYVLRDETNNLTYKLDDQNRAKENEGKTVKVNGTLDSSTNTIQISTLEPNG